MWARVRIGHQLPGWDGQAREGVVLLLCCILLPGRFRRQIALSPRPGKGPPWAGAGGMVEGPSERLWPAGGICSQWRGRCGAREGS